MNGFWFNIEINLKALLIGTPWYYPVMIWDLLAEIWWYFIYNT